MKNAIIAMMFALSACVSGPDPQFHKDDMSMYHKDAYECERDTLGVANPYTFGPGYMGDANARAFAVRCMRSKGYSFY